MFGIVDRLLLRPPPFLADPARTSLVYLASTYQGVENLQSSISYARYVNLTNSTKSFSQTAAFFYYDLAVGTGDETAERHVGMVSASFWRLFDGPPALGRYFGPAEDHTPEGSPVAVLGYNYWQSRYDGRADVLGRSISLGMRQYTIVRVAPRGFIGLDPLGAVAFVPITASALDIVGAGVFDKDTWYTTSRVTWLKMLVRRKAGVTTEVADADLTNAYRRGYLAEPKRAPIEIARPHAIAASVLAERGPNRSSNAKVATWLVGVSVIVLLIACANVANLLLARAFRRRREIAVVLRWG